MPEVKCSVANCYFWAEGNKCTADAIMVEIDPHANRRFDEEIGGEMVGTGHRDYSARRSADTCCHTFRLKEKHR
ncbi:protein of unknown function [Planifilum fulgidum]|uniref:DUF1540 domain-containing protein n=1 Tax=Planifilum fulgidum TaxID=201973 RepID=A0A1I2KLP3_9BACL|nr:DUF1540 domain-containing protein [Planifilum fulgidum]MBO2495611.1 DUF1540 domain-containing protein [Bacillota bacterium]MBO2533720.1 DUF1540 domain-containing protein [Thermoactinomycetaceae bacterium]SFF67258.1 protein of unknown function [Planifilum fulgidum]